VLGLILCAMAVVYRLAAGSAKPAGALHSPQNVLLIGMAALIAGCWFKLTAR
jgi:hypothetical protein